MGLNRSVLKKELSRMNIEDQGNVMLHPVRLRILTELSHSKATSKQLLERLPDIPQATLYRHLKRLLDAEFIYIAQQHTVNGALEKTYAVKESQSVSEEQQKSITGTSHIKLFSLFMGAMLDTLKRYVKGRSGKQIIEEGLSYNRLTLYLSNQERKNLQHEMRELIARYHLPNEATRRKYSIAITVIPDERDTL